MTLKEKVARNKPYMIDISCWGGVKGCPSDYRHLFDGADMNMCKGVHRIGSYERCGRCWGQEIPGTETKKGVHMDADEFVEWLENEIKAFKAAIECEMTANEYQQMALRTEPENLTRDDCPLSVRLSHGLMGLNGEAGEAIDILKKHIFQGHDLDKEHLAKELGDVAWYLAVTANALGYSLEDIFKMNIEKLKARYPEGFDSDKSVNRAKDDI